MYQIDKTTNSIAALSAKGFSELGFSERANLQGWIAKCPECLGEELLIIAKEFDGFDDDGRLLLSLEQIIPTPEAEDFMIRVAEKEKEQQVAERAEAKSEKIRPVFWEDALAALAEAGVTLFSNVRPTKDNWLDAGSGLGDVTYRMIFGQKDVLAGIGIMRRSREENKWIFDRLHEQKDVIEADFGGPLDWHRMDDNIRSKIQCWKECDGDNPENWPELTGWLVDHIQRLEKVFSPRLAKIGKDLKAGISQTAEPSPSEAVDV